VSRAVRIGAGVAVAGAAVALVLVLPHWLSDAKAAEFARAGCFFIAILNLWKPYQAMRSLWRSSHSVNRPEYQESTWVLPSWWTLWLISSFIGNATWRMQMGGSHTLQDYQTLTQIQLVECVVDVFLCLVASIMVSRTWQAQAAQRENPEEAPKGFADAA